MFKEASFYEKLKEERVRCFLCPHRCLILPDKFGICGVRKNIKGVLYTLVYGKPLTRHIDPIEKKPLYHFLPGSSSYSLATAGCNFRCDFCQNWQISQLRGENISGEDVPAREIVKEAENLNCASISYTYTEPTIFFEYAYDIAKLAKEKNIKNIFVTNGYISKPAIETISSYLDAANIDLKSFSENYYRKICGGHLKPVCEAIEYMKELNIWVEITTLIVPGENDSQDELKELAQFIASLDKNIPWHISRFHPDYKMQDKEATDIEILRKAKSIGEKEGLRYIYLGNVLEGNDTFCPFCGNILIEREYFFSRLEGLDKGKCKKCGEKIPGIWG